MRKNVEINFSYVKHEFLVRFFEEGNLVKWEIVNDTRDIQKFIAAFYFPDKV